MVRTLALIAVLLLAAVVYLDELSPPAPVGRPGAPAGGPRRRPAAPRPGWLDPLYWLRDRFM